ncbi:MAG: hypothetical protein RMM08_10615 [Armatimonadota bacterium]|nr:hypothetical protein [bacterium]MDW8321805.1 hypothetical protein [Armatimonadota bacterium]
MIQSHQRGSLDVGYREFTVPPGQVSLFGMVSASSEENRAKVWLRTGVTPRLDVGAGYSHMGNRFSLIATWHPLSSRDGLPFDVLLGYGFSSSNVREQEGFYAFAVKSFGNLSLVTGFERLRNGRNIGVLAGSFVLTPDTGLMFYLHTGSMPGEPTLYNLAFIRRVGEWQIGLWWFHPSRESTVGLSFTTQFTLGGRQGD